MKTKVDDNNAQIQIITKKDGFRQECLPPRLIRKMVADF